MAVYRLSAEPRFLLQRRWTVAWRLALYLGAALAGVAWAKADWILDLSKLAGLLGLVTGYGLWKIERELWFRASTAVDVSPDGIHVTAAERPERFLRREDITSLVELSNGSGLWVRSANPRRTKSVIVPRDLEDLEACRAELVAMGIPLTPPDPHRVGKLWAIGIIFWSMVQFFIARSLAIHVASGVAIGGALLAMWAAGWTKAKPGATCALPDKSPEEKARSQQKAQKFGVIITAAGIAIMMLEAWWTHGTDELAFGFFVVLIGVIVFAVGYFSGTIAASVLALGALTASGAAVGGLTWWLVPSSDLGSLIAVTVGATASIALAVSLLGRLLDRSPRVVPVLEMAAGPVFVALGVWGLYWKEHADAAHVHDAAAQIAAGVIVTIYVIGMRNERARPLLLKIATPLKLAALAVVFVSLIGHSSNLTWPCLIVFWWMPRGSGQQASTPAPVVGADAT